jgi:hypothetical protein
MYAYVVSVHSGDLDRVQNLCICFYFLLHQSPVTFRVPCRKPGRLRRLSTRFRVSSMFRKSGLFTVIDQFYCVTVYATCYWKLIHLLIFQLPFSSNESMLVMRTFQFRKVLVGFSRWGSWSYSSSCEMFPKYDWILRERKLIKLTGWNISFRLIVVIWEVSIV